MEQPIITNPSPRAKFRASKEQVRIHRDIISNPSLLHAIDEAMLEYAFQMTMQSKDGNSAATAQFKLCGVHEFVHLLKTFAETPQQMPRTVVNDNLAQPTSALK